MFMDAEREAGGNLRSSPSGFDGDALPEEAGDTLSGLTAEEAIIVKDEPEDIKDGLGDAFL